MMIGFLKKEAKAEVQNVSFILRSAFRKAEDFHIPILLHLSFGLKLCEILYHLSSTTLTQKPLDLSITIVSIYPS